MAEKIKHFSYIIGGIVALNLILYFFVPNCVRDIVRLFIGEDIIYYNWRSLPILISMPMVLSIEILLISCFFTKDKKVHPVMMKYVNKFGVSICIIFFLSVFCSPIISIVFAFSSYHPCASSSIFSGIYYVKDKTKCYGLNGVIPWKKGYGYNNDVKQ
ncbi:DUF1240 domain-containing protein [Rahnella sikkimica]|uniref:DUF1240 domain-containing protein n=1 Tax=Rahnella sikkimica TaxID=1805933 RepID=A0A2L1UVT2_9GAMM|nr:DUF1240 domain-containing protein [Rahnella sikkimica]AVF36948.1 hypothetical protein BV494_19385 [Rahnella sikkimica]